MTDQLPPLAPLPPMTPEQWERVWSIYLSGMISGYGTAIMRNAERHGLTEPPVELVSEVVARFVDQVSDDPAWRLEIRQMIERFWETGTETDPKTATAFVSGGRS